MFRWSALALLYSKKLELQWSDHTPDAEAVKHRLFLDDPYLSRHIPSSLEFDAGITPIYLSTQPTNNPLIQNARRYHRRIPPPRRHLIRQSRGPQTRRITLSYRLPRTLMLHNHGHRARQRRLQSRFVTTTRTLSHFFTRSATQYTDTKTNEKGSLLTATVPQIWEWTSSLRAISRCIAISLEGSRSAVPSLM